MPAHVEVTRVDAVQVLRLARPEKKNALTSAMYAALADALASGEASGDVAAHVIFGSGGVFCAGNDMNDFLRRAAVKPVPGEKVSAPSGEFIRALPGVTKPMIAAVDGLAVGIGVTLLLHCDLVLASPAASFRAPFVNLGIIQEAGSSVIGPHRLGYNNAFELLVLGHAWDGARAKEAGLVNWVVPASDLDARAHALAAELGAKPRAALMAARHMLRGDPSAIKAAIEQETQIYTSLFASPEAKEAFASFLEKRKPDFAKARAAAKTAG